MSQVIPVPDAPSEPSAYYTEEDFIYIQGTAPNGLYVGRERSYQAWQIRPEPNYQKNDVFIMNEMQWRIQEIAPLDADGIASWLYRAVLHPSNPHNIPSQTFTEAQIEGRLRAARRYQTYDRFRNNGRNWVVTKKFFFVPDSDINQWMYEIADEHRSLANQIKSETELDSWVQIV
ncbi:hypothetical protein TWF694_011926 [Orbilia ellipsospora]|uniref:Uncharacterized protein n=1 Tax=Orbilia ellipsospora TaxID=2528407 RepID=A0AAV9XGK2_9PEZI